MPASIIAYPHGQVELVGDVDWVADVVKCLLLQNSYVYDKTDRYVADITPATHEHDGSGYARVAMAGKTRALTGDGNGAELGGNDVTFASLAAGSLDIRFAAFYAEVLTDADSKLLFLVDFGADQTPNGFPFVVTEPTTGWMNTANRLGVDAGTTVDGDSASGQKVLNVASTVNMLVGGRVAIDPFDAGSRLEAGVIDAITAGVSITLVSNLAFAHTAGQADKVHVEN